HNNRSIIAKESRFVNCRKSTKKRKIEPVSEGVAPEAACPNRPEALPALHSVEVHAVHSVQFQKS
ncbi:MAG: hypothetical protein II932_08185, partial [Treponema sp.]|nr:hypothetical protein [Treponema sp.]